MIQPLDYATPPPRVVRKLPALLAMYGAGLLVASLVLLGFIVGKLGEWKPGDDIAVVLWVVLAIIELVLLLNDPKVLARPDETWDRTWLAFWLAAVSWCVPFLLWYATAWNQGYRPTGW